MKHRFFKDGKVEMVEITVGPGSDVVVRPATKEDHDNAKNDDPDPKDVQPTKEDAAPAKKSRHLEDD